MMSQRNSSCSLTPGDGQSHARSGAKVGATVGASLGSKAGPVAAGIASGLGGATGYIAGTVIDDITDGGRGGRLLPDGGRRPGEVTDRSDGEGSATRIPVTESDR